jgi:hypothetical protein
MVVGKCLAIVARFPLKPCSETSNSATIFPARTGPCRVRLSDDIRSRATANLEEDSDYSGFIENIVSFGVSSTHYILFVPVVFFN